MKLGRYRLRYGNGRLVSWMDRRCIECGKFINSKGKGVSTKILCKKCLDKRRRQSNLVRDTVRTITLKEIRNIIKIPIPHKIRQKLWYWCC